MMVTSLSIAFVGNSILYYNDCPRVLESMLKSSMSSNHIIEQDSCLRGGATLSSIWQQGNGMADKFVDHKNSNNENGVCTNNDIGADTVESLLEEKAWSFVVLNDYTQGPARETTRQETIQTLRDYYIPAWKKQNPTPTIIWLQTMAYRRVSIKGTTDLGDLDTFTNLIWQGYREYQKLCQSNGLSSTVAPVGQAVRQVYHQNPDLWTKLYNQDDFHPSPHGTWLQACVLYIIITGHDPPVYQDDFFEKCRYRQPPSQEALPLPTNQEAEALRRFAIDTCTEYRTLITKSQL